MDILTDVGGIFEDTYNIAQSHPLPFLASTLSKRAVQKYVTPKSIFWIA